MRKKIEQRYAKASAAAELEGSTVESKMLEVEHAAMNTEAQARLEQIRSQLGLASTPESAPASEATAAPAGEAAVAEPGASEATDASAPPPA